MVESTFPDGCSKGQEEFFASLACFSVRTLEFAHPGVDSFGFAEVGPAFPIGVGFNRFNSNGSFRRMDKAVEIRSGGIEMRVQDPSWGGKGNWWEKAVRKSWSFGSLCLAQDLLE